MRRPAPVLAAEEVARSSVAAVTRRLPLRFRGRSRMFALIDGHLSEAGRGPVVVAPMQLGYRMLVDLRSRTEKAAYWTGRYDSIYLRGVLELVRRAGTGVVVMDVGANIGFWTIPLAQQAARQDGTVFSFEPLPANAARLRVNAELNGVADAVSVQQLALGDADVTLPINVAEDAARGASTGNTALVPPGVEPSQATVMVEVRTLDSQLDRLGVDRVDVVKVDVEGFEAKFLAGAAETVRRFRPTLVVEWSMGRMRRLRIDPASPIGGFVEDNGYAVLRFDGEQGWVTQPAFWSPLAQENLMLVPSERADETRAVMVDFAPLQR